MWYLSIKLNCELVFILLDVVVVVRLFGPRSRVSRERSDLFNCDLEETDDSAGRSCAIIPHLNRASQIPSSWVRAYDTYQYSIRETF